MRMPKPKPDQTIRHEISLSRPTQDLLSDAVVAYQINKVATPMVSLLSDASAMAIIIGVLGAYIHHDSWAPVFDEITGGIYTTYEEGLAAIDNAIDLLEDTQEKIEETKAAVANNPIVKAWLWLATSGRILQSQMGVGR